MGEPDNPDQKNQANMARHCRQNLGIYSVSFWHTTKSKKLFGKFIQHRCTNNFFSSHAYFFWLFVCNYLVKESLILLSVQRNRNVHLQRRKSWRSSFWVDSLCKEFHTNFVFFYHKLEWLFQLYIEYWHLEFTKQFQDLYKVGPYSEILKQSGSVPSIGKSGGFVDSG